MTLPIHPLAEFFPLMQGRAFDDLVEDIRDNGLLEAIVLLDGMVLDGRNRLRACERLQIKPKAVEFKGNDPLAFVISKNLRRRQLKQAQRALVAARLANCPRYRPRKTIRERKNLVTQHEAAALLAVSRKSVQVAKSMQGRADPKLMALVETGNVSLNAAYIVSQLPQKEQARLCKDGPRAIVARARKFRAHRGHQGRSNYAAIWKEVDAVCDALEARRLDQADIAARRLQRVIAETAAERPGTEPLPQPQAEARR